MKIKMINFLFLIPTVIGPMGRFWFVFTSK
jgi:hypothetical protein